MNTDLSLPRHGHRPPLSLPSPCRVGFPRDAQGGLETLQLMRHLRYLELAGNPLAEEKGYRLLVIKNLPWLETLDMHKVRKKGIGA